MLCVFVHERETEQGLCFELINSSLNHFHLSSFSFFPISTFDLLFNSVTPGFFTYKTYPNKEMLIRCSSSEGEIKLED
jgi:hypothetical protein